MATTYDLGVPPLWSEWNLGLELALGTITTYKSSNHSVKKAVYQDIAGATPWPNPLSLDAYGRSTGPIYFKNDPADDAYYIEVKNFTGTTMYTIDNYNGALIAVPSVASDASDKLNFVMNPQFLIWDHEPVHFTGGTTIVTTKVTALTPEQVCDEWYIYKSAATTTTDNISRQEFTAGQPEVPGNPRYYMRYTCTAVGAVETRKSIMQFFYSGAGFLSGTDCIFSIAARGSANLNLKVYWNQNFGTGGSPATATRVLLTPIIPITTSFSTYTYAVRPDSIAGMAFGTNGDDYCFLEFEMDMNNPSLTYDFCNVLLQLGTDTSVVFPINDYSGYVSQFDNWFQRQTGEHEFISLSSSMGSQSLRTNWVKMTDQTIGQPGSGATIASLACFNLFCYLYDVYANAECPVSTGRTAGPSSTAAVIDWNLGKTITLPLTLSRLMGNSGAGAGLTTRLPGAANAAAGAEAKVIGAANLPAHTHLANASGTQVPASATANGFAANPALVGGGNKFVESGNGGVDAIINFTNTGNNTSPNTALDVMNPFSFLPLYIHL